MKRRARTRTLALLLLAALLLSPAGTVRAEDTDAVHIRSAEDFRAFVQSCSYDAWSLGKTVYLDRDISLTGAADLPAASFGGTFEGGGHTVSGLEITDSVSPAGLFGNLAPGALVRDLHVEGTVAPEGSGDRVGGIAGVNRGTIQNCSFSGTVTGESLTGGIAGENGPEGAIRGCEVSGGVFSKRMTGGIAGLNGGLIANCVNKAYVNTNTLDPALTLSELNRDLGDALRRITSPDTYNLVTDSGGVAGCNEGTLSACSSSGTVGYRHVGYNVGGIAGRSRGYVTGCRNRGAVYGRKSVGGIVGVAEPYVQLSLTENTTQTVRDQLDTLNALVNRAVGDASDGSAAVSARLTALGASVNDAKDKVRDLGNQAVGYLDDTVAELDRGSALLEASLPFLRLAANDLLTASGRLTEGVGLFGSALDRFEEGQVLDHLRRACGELATASDLLDENLRLLLAAQESLKGAVGPAEGLTEAEWHTLLYGGTDREGKAVTGALNDLRAGISAMETAHKSIRDTLRDLNKALEEGSITTLGELWDYLSGKDLEDALKSGGEGLVKTAEALAVIGDSTAFESDAVKLAFHQLTYAVNLLAYGRDGYGGVFTYLRFAFGEFGAAASGAEAPAGDLRAGVSALGDASAQAGQALEDLGKLLDMLCAAEPIHLEAPGTVTTEASDALFDSLQGISDQLEQLNGETRGASDAVLQDIRRINDQFLLLMHTLLNTLDEAENATAADKIEDTSDENIDEARDGKLFQCVNNGTVNGDIDVGGIAGAMMIYNALDPEEDRETSLSSIVHRTYALKCILQACVSDGEITGKRSHAGAVCGDAQLGVISACEAYGTVLCETGDWVGGIAGHGDNVIRGCWSRCRLSGRKYVGGIVGSGEEEGSNLRVSQCRSMAAIDSCQEFAGAIAGTGCGVFTDNAFVSDSLTGLGRVSVQGQAEPMDYTSLLSVTGLPRRFRSFTLRFLADGEVIASRTFLYGDSFDGSVYPAIPAKEGMYGVWDRTELRDLHFDTDVSVIYRKNVTAVPSEVTRVDTRPVFFVSGAFIQGDELQISPAILAFEPDRTGPWNALRARGSTLLEQWTVTLPRDGAETHQVRYLPPKTAIGSLELYRAADGGWVKLDTQRIGSYLCFTLAGEEATLSLVSVTIPWWGWAIAGGILLALLIFLIALFMRKKAKPEQSEEEKKRTLRFRRRRRLVLILLPLLILALGLASFLLLQRTNFTLNQELYYLLRTFAERRETDMDLTFSLTGEGEVHRVSVPLYTADCGGKRVSCAAWEGIPLYYYDKTLLLENGRAYPLGDLLPDQGTLLTGAAKLYRSLEITVTEENDQRIYHADTDSPEAISALRDCLPAFARSAFDPARIDLDLYVRDREVRRLEARWDTPEGEARLGIGLSVTERPHEIPLAVQNAVAAGVKRTAEDGEDLATLLEAWTELASRESLEAEAALKANCGPLLLDEALTWQYTRRYAEPLSRVQRLGTALYFTEEAACTEDGTAFALNDTVFSREGQLLRLIYRAVLLGETKTETVQGGRRYTVTLDGEAMDAFTRIIAPQADLSALSFREGTASVLLTEGRVSEVQVKCRGSIRIVGVESAASLSGRLTFTDGAFPPLPGKVMDALGLRS
jgi:hypothetical protein